MSQRWISGAEFDRDLRRAVAETENEIVAHALGVDEPDYGGAEFLEEQSESEGWDGENLSIAEIAHQNIHGRDDTGNDRPIQAQEELSLQQQNELLRRELAEEKKLVDDWLREPLVMQQRDQVRENVRQQLEQVVFGGNEKIDSYIRDVAAAQQQTQALLNNRVEESLTRAAQKYGRDFDDVYADLIATPVNNRLAQEIVKSVYDSADPGEALMQLHGNSLVRSLGHRNPPFLSQTHPRVPERAPRASSGGYDSGWGDRDTEQSIFDAATWND
jgi:hypothetical protein